MKHPFLCFLAVLCIGIGAGFLNGLLGAGGGILIVFGLQRLLRRTIKDPRSVYASAIAVMLPLSLLSAYQYFQKNSPDPSTLLVLILPAIVGGVIGGLLLRKLSPSALSRIFAAVVLISGVILVV